MLTLKLRLEGSKQNWDNVWKNPSIPFSAGLFSESTHLQAFPSNSFNLPPTTERSMKLLEESKLKQTISLPFCLNQNLWFKKSLTINKS